MDYPMVDIKRVDKSFPLPEYQTNGAIGFDMYSRKTVTVYTGEIELLPSNLIVKVPEGYGLFIFPRSSLARKFGGLMFPHSVGLIDQDYSGEKDEIMIQVYNQTKWPAVVNAGERIAQGVFMPIEKAVWNEVETMSNENRGGFGSTG